MRLVSMLVVLALAGCAAHKSPARSIEGRDWDLVALGERDHPLGNGSKPATLRLDAATKRAGGNAGCNRYNAAYVLAGDSLRFEAAMSTRMACDEGMDLETAWLGAMSHVATWSATDTTLELEGPDGRLARFREHQGP